MAYPTVNQGTMRDRLSWAQPSGGLIGREDTQYAEDIATEVRWKNPATLIVMKLNRETSGTVDTHWWDDEHLPLTDQINYGTGYSNSATSLVVDNISHFAVGEIWRFDASGENVMVYARDTDNSAIHVVRDFGQGEGWTAAKAAILDDAWLRKVGSAYEPGHETPGQRTTQDVERINYHQNHRTGVAITERSAGTRLRGEQDLARQRWKRAEDHQAGIETAFWDGKPYAGDKGHYDEDTGNLAPSSCGGVEHYMVEYGNSDKLIDQTDLTEMEFMEALEIAFDKNKEMWLWCPPSLRWAMDKWGISKQNTFETTTVLGMKINAWQASEGDLYIVTHDYLKAHDSSSWNRAFILDMETKGMSFMDRPGGSTRHKEIVVANGATVFKEEYESDFSFIFRLPKHDCRLRYKTITVT